MTQIDVTSSVLKTIKNWYNRAAKGRNQPKLRQGGISGTFEQITTAIAKKLDTTKEIIASIVGKLISDRKVEFKNGRLTLTRQKPSKSKRQPTVRTTTPSSFEPVEAHRRLSPEELAEKERRRAWADEYEMYDVA